MEVPKLVRWPQQDRANRCWSGGFQPCSTISRQRDTDPIYGERQEEAEEEFEDELEEEEGEEAQEGEEEALEREESKSQATGKIDEEVLDWNIDVLFFSSALLSPPSILCLRRRSSTE